MFINPVVTNDTNSILADVTGITGVQQAILYGDVSFGGPGWGCTFFAEPTLETIVGGTGGVPITGNGVYEIFPNGGYTLGGTITVANFGSIDVDEDIVVTWEETPPPGGNVGVIGSGIV